MENFFGIMVVEDIRSKRWCLRLTRHRLQPDQQPPSSPMPARYAPVPNPRSAPDYERELDDAFESDNEEDHTESTPLTHSNNNNIHSEGVVSANTSPPGAYDFERDYDYPPPGSPPGPSALALPNSHGNSNGQMPGSPIRTAFPQPSFFRRVVGSVLPTHYSRVPTHRTRGGGIENDGVFANVMAKPQRATVVHTEDGDIHMVPEDIQKEAPPVSAHWFFTLHEDTDPFPSLMLTHKPMLCHPTGRPPSTHQVWSQART